MEKNKATRKVCMDLDTLRMVTEHASVMNTILDAIKESDKEIRAVIESLEQVAWAELNKKTISARNEEIFNVIAANDKNNANEKLN